MSVGGPSAPGAGSSSEKDFTSYLGMVIFLGGWALMFAALFFAYGVVRLDAKMWPPEGETRLPVLLPAINTGVLLLSSLTMHQALRTIRNWRVVDLPRWMLATAGLGVLFIVLQFVTWTSLWKTGLRPSSGIYGSVFYALTAIHAVHVIVGLIALATVSTQALRGRYRKNRHNPVRLVAMFWHFVDVVWLLMFFLVYVY